MHSCKPGAAENNMCERESLKLNEDNESALSVQMVLGASHGWSW